MNLGWIFIPYISAICNSVTQTHNSTNTDMAPTQCWPSCWLTLDSERHMHLGVYNFIQLKDISNVISGSKQMTAIYLLLHFEDTVTRRTWGISVSSFPFAMILWLNTIHVSVVWRPCTDGSLTLSHSGDIFHFLWHRSAGRAWAISVSSSLFLWLFSWI